MSPRYSAWSVRRTSFEALRNTKNGFYRDAAAELERVTSDAATLEQQLNQRQDRLDRTTVTAPVNGIVKNLSINTAGAVVGAGRH